MPLDRREFFRTGAAAGAALALASPRLFAADTPAVARLKTFTLLNSNENAYGMPEKVRAAALDALAYGNRYPDREVDDLVDAIAALHKVKREQVVMGCGSTEILRMAADAFARPTLIMADPTFEAIAQYAGVNGSEIVKRPLRPDYAHQLDPMPAMPFLHYVCNPNNPTATLTPRKEIEAAVAALPANGYMLVDEAYHHFAVGAPEYESFLDKPVDHPRVIVARTFSKIYGMAGIRLGYAVGAAETMARLRRTQSQDDVNMIAALCGIVALEDAAGTQAMAARIRADRSEFLAQATKRKIETLPCYTNFVMMKTGRPIRDLIAYFRTQKIAIGRPFPPMLEHARISLGTPAEMKAFWKAWDGMPAQLAEFVGPEPRYRLS
jgi:histidinol-phosphate aminotransferase